MLGVFFGFFWHQQGDSQRSVASSEMVTVDGRLLDSHPSTQEKGEEAAVCQIMQDLD